MRIQIFKKINLIFGLEVNNMDAEHYAFFALSDKMCTEHF